MQRDDQAFIHFQECISCLNKAWNIVCELQGNEPRNAIWRAAYRMVLIEYAKPFKVSKGEHRRRHKLEAVSDSSLNKELHNRIIELRDQFLAHSDLTIKDARLHLGEINGVPFPLISQNIEPALPDIGDVKELIESTLDILYRQLKEFESSYERKES